MAMFPDGNMSRGIIVQSSDDAHQLHKAMLRTSLFINSSYELSEYGIQNTANSDERETPFSVKRNEVSCSSTTGCQVVSLDCLRYQPFWPVISEHGKMKAHPFQEMNHHSTQQNPLLTMKAQMNKEILAKKISFSGSSSLELEKQMEHPEKKIGTVGHPCEKMVEGLKVMESNQDKPYRGYFGNLLIYVTRRDTFLEDKQPENIVEDVLK